MLKWGQSLGEREELVAAGGKRSLTRSGNFRELIARETKLV